MKNGRWPAEFPLAERERNGTARDLEKGSALFPHGTVSADLDIVKVSPSITVIRLTYCQIVGALSMKLLADVKAAQEGLGQNSPNSSRPPGGEAPWGRRPSDEPGVEATSGSEEDSERQDAVGPRGAGTLRICPYRRAGNSSGSRGCSRAW
jgi:hypothetical protein